MLKKISDYLYLQDIGRDLCRFGYIVLVMLIGFALASLLIFGAPIWIPLFIIGFVLLFIASLVGPTLLAVVLKFGPLIET
jgi:hypothetical protein